MTRLSRILGVWFTYYAPVLINFMTPSKYLSIAYQGINLRRLLSFFFSSKAPHECANGKAFYITHWPVPSFSDNNLTTPGYKIWDVFSLQWWSFKLNLQVYGKNSPISQKKSQISWTDMYLVRFLPNFTDLPEFHGSATTWNFWSTAQQWFFIFQELRVKNLLLCPL